jgi:hypothetical protein
MTRFQEIDMFRFMQMAAAVRLITIVGFSAAVAAVASGVLDGLDAGILSADGFGWGGAPASGGGL